MGMTVQIIPVSTQNVGARTFSTGNKVNTWKVTFQIDGGGMRTVMSVPIEGPSSANLAVKDALNKLHEFLLEAGHAAELEKDAAEFKWGR